MGVRQYFKSDAPEFAPRFGDTIYFSGSFSTGKKLWQLTRAAYAV